MSYIIQHRYSGCYQSPVPLRLVVDPNSAMQFWARCAAEDYINRNLVPRLYWVAARPETRDLLSKPMGPHPC